MGPSRDGIEPTVLLVGAGERFTPAFQAALSRHHVFVETTELLSVVDAVVVTAPDLVLLMGEAARDGGSLVLQKLAGLSQNFSVPVVVLNDDAELDAKLSAFRHGATAVLPRSASVDATAEQVAKLARELPEQGTESQGSLGEATLDEFVSALSKQLRTGLTTALSPDSGEGEDVRLVLGRGRPLTEFLDNFVRRVRRHVVRAEPLRYELGDDARSASGPGPASPPPDLSRLRMVLADDDTPRADAVAQELRARGITVVVTDLSPSEERFQTLRHTDPAVFLIGESHAHGDGYALLRRLRRDTRLRWASLLVVRWEDVWPDQRSPPRIERLESTLANLLEPERALLARVEVRAQFETRLEMTGPARCLRALERTGHPIRVHVENPRVTLAVDVSDGLVVGAEGRTREADGKAIAGISALSALLVLGSGRLRIEPVDQPASANVMSPVDVALTMADAEPPPITPSIPAAGTVSLHPPLHAPATEERAPATLRPAPVVAVGPAPVPASTGSAPMHGRPIPLGAPEARPPRPLAPAPVPSFAVPEPSPPSPRHERNPPAMTLPTTSGTQSPAPPAPERPAPQELSAPAPSPFVERLRKLSAWLAQQDAKLHGKRISKRTAGVLVGLAALQGLFLVTLYAGGQKLFGHETAEVSSASAAPEFRATPPAPVAEAVAARSAATVPAPGSERTPAAARPPVPAATSSGADGSGRSAASCEELLSDSPPRQGYYPGAAIQQARAGRSAIVRGNLHVAQTALCRAVAWDDKNSEFALELGLVFLLQRDGARAAEWTGKAIELAPDSRKAKDAHGDALARLGQAEAARAAWMAGAGLDPSHESGARALVARELKQADRALRLNDLVVAERYFRRAAILEPRSLSALIGLSYSLVQLGDVPAGTLWARRAVELSPRNAAARLALGDALARAGETERAIAEWREASLLDPDLREATRRLRKAGVPAQ